MDIIQCLMLQNWVETPKLNKLSHKAEQSIQAGMPGNSDLYLAKLERNTLNQVLN